MNKATLIGQVADKAGLTKKDADKAVAAVFESIREGLSDPSDGKVSIPMFGTFEAVERSEHVGHNPATGESITIPACRIVKFKPSHSLKDTIN